MGFMIQYIQMRLSVWMKTFSSFTPSSSFISFAFIAANTNPFNSRLGTLILLFGDTILDVAKIRFILYLPVLVRNLMNTTIPYENSPPSQNMCNSSSSLAGGLMNSPFSFPNKYRLDLNSLINLISFSHEEKSASICNGKASSQVKRNGFLVLTLLVSTSEFAFIFI